MAEIENTQAAQPDEQVLALDRLAGTWRVSGGAKGTVTYRWLAGGFFLIQDIALEHDGRKITGIEVIGRERPFMSDKSSEDIKSRVYDSEGNTLDYVYELDGDTLTIWGLEKGSPAYYRGTFDADGDTVRGGWVFPGGGYQTVMTRIG
ncbi:hypothetical protein [Acrocarpospora catenulata]|uniref:hypothetical protein n=1 Tax=Acrocarpospora catenulata TaxID=2836182 RepID=UPI001BDB4DCD|nr:hypothetical protein [Acrocarpospora catenulata]